MFRYTTVAEATAEWKRRQAEAEKSAPKSSAPDKAAGAQQPVEKSAPAQQAAPEQKSETVAKP
jgi:hypothetical protein